MDVKAKNEMPLGVYRCPRSDRCKVSQEKTLASNDGDGHGERVSHLGTCHLTHGAAGFFP